MSPFFSSRRKAFQFAWHGIRLFIQEPHARIHFTLAIIALVAAGFFQFSLIEWSLLFVCIGMVLGAEAFNSAIERIVNKISPEHNLEAGRIKDISAGAVLLVCIFVFLVGLLLFVPKITLLF